MKFLVLTWSFLWLASAKASPVALLPEQLDVFKTAVSIPVSQASYDCKSLSGYILPSDIQVAVDGATEGSVDTDGVQPIIIFVYIFDSSKWVVRITSSPDFRSVSGVNLEMFDQQQVNSGDLKNPAIEFGYISSGQLNCLVKK
jgi:hypothetical protein